MREKVKLLSTAGTGHFYVATKNKRLHPDKMNVKKYDPVVRKHVDVQGIEDQVIVAQSGAINEATKKAPPVTRRALFFAYSTPSTTALNSVRTWGGGGIVLGSGMSWITGSLAGGSRRHPQSFVLYRRTSRPKRLHPLSDRIAMISAPNRPHSYTCPNYPKSKPPAAASSRMSSAAASIACACTIGVCVGR